LRRMLWLRRVLTGDGRQASFNKERDIPGKELPQKSESYCRKSEICCHK
jgi:hypothetical protein